MSRNTAPKPFAQPFAQALVVGVLDDEGHTSPLPAQFEYDPSDPFAMTLVFDVEPAPRRWRFARELFIDGYYTPTGDGDVTVFPCLDSDGRATVVLSLCSLDGEAAVEVNARTASQLIWRMVDLVPRGAEGPAYDVDAVLEQLLREAAAAPLATHAVRWARKR